MKLPVVVLASLLATTAVAAPLTQPEVDAANAKAFDAALAKQKLAVQPLKEELREHANSFTAPPSRPGHIDLIVTNGWRAEEVLFVRNAKHEVFRVRRAPKVVAKLEEHLGCRAVKFAGGRAWTEHVRYALPAGDTFKGDLEVAYDVTAWVTIDATTQPDGTPCPPSATALD